MSNTGQLWTIDELGSQVALALASDYDGAPNGRVRSVPDLRTIRYYTTLGLLDRPAQMRGRTALYARRHLLQLVAVKRLQARGLALAEIQEKLLGQTDRKLAEIARLPLFPFSPAEKGVEVKAETREEFWKARPAEPPRDQRPLEIAASAQPHVPLQGVPLAADVTLLLSTLRPLETDDLEALRAVAAPLLKLLHARRLLGPRPEGDHS
ncbi:MAG: MerR family transcriptional regulator [Planctomycetia bacterium]|nr:MerR family transcriptional regulator [Planctomycetia bacterium]